MGTAAAWLHSCTRSLPLKPSVCAASQRSVDAAPSPPSPLLLGAAAAAAASARAIASAAVGSCWPPRPLGPALAPPPKVVLGRRAASAAAASRRVPTAAAQALSSGS